MARLAVLLWLCLGLPAVRGSGFFELQVLGIDNPGRELLDGGCCGGVARTSGRCPGQCNTIFRLCLKEYQASVDLAGPCTFGNLTSPLIGGSSFSVKTHPDQQLLLRLPFHFSCSAAASYESEWSEKGVLSGVLRRRHGRPLASRVGRLSGRARRNAEPGPVPRPAEPPRAPGLL
ncbi:jag2 protein, putative [Ixodes scapularis]|uniref:Jag2 protein, putative n=1 Tax=Ixodes scapularis TaxID=6945 RepID=B7PW67_IXOSC|nr:jag2 protein, putative [Ixodes scapularis]|eukprot:XP_002409384.1 jag2 protein, putative [Ixodes scapularis]